MSILQEEYPGEDNPNAAPTETLPVLRAGDDGQIECVPMRWWLTPSWSQGPSTRYSMFNAKAETRPRTDFSGPFATQRCVVPVSGFYEWQRRAGHKQPFLICDRAKRVCCSRVYGMPGSHEAVPVTRQSFEFHFADDRRASQLGRPASAGFLRPEQAVQWLDPQVETGALKSLLASDLPIPLQLTPVSSEVNSARNKSPVLSTCGPGTARQRRGGVRGCLFRDDQSELFEQESMLLIREDWSAKGSTSRGQQSRGAGGSRS